MYHRQALKLTFQVENFKALEFARANGIKDNQEKGACMDKEAIYKLIKAAEEALKPTHADAATLETKVKPDTENQYKKQAKKLFGVDTETNEPNIIPTDASLIIANVREAETVSTLRKRARAIRHVCMNMLNMFLKNIDNAERKGNWNSVVLNCIEY